ncbi:hypothetical protein N9U47_02540 [Candidatus Pelagibacter sp.]|nr:hypothetical protein [Candidatus Pelagibacter sp.]
MTYLKFSLGIFLVLAASRFIPHPPNFTSLIALSFYIPAILGLRYLPAVLICFGLTDLIIGFHGTILFTWGSVIVIGFLSTKLFRNISSRISGALLGALIFFIITNFGVWSLGSYGYTLEGIIICYTLALPFFGYSLISTLLFSALIESLIKTQFFKNNIFRFNY